MSFSRGRWLPPSPVRLKNWFSWLNFNGHTEFCRLPHIPPSFLPVADCTNSGDEVLWLRRPWNLERHRQQNLLEPCSSSTTVWHMKLLFLYRFDNSLPELMNHTTKTKPKWSWSVTRAWQPFYFSFLATIKWYSSFFHSLKYENYLPPSPQQTLLSCLSFLSSAQHIWLQLDRVDLF